MNNIIIENKSFEQIENKYVLTHWQDDIELLRVVEGAMHCFINGKEYTINQGDVCVINQKQLHQIYNCNNKDTKFQCLVIEPSLFTADKEVYKKYIDPILTDSNFSHIISKMNSQSTKEIINLMDLIYDSQNVEIEGHELLEIAFLHIIFQKIYNLYSNKQNNISVNNDIMIYRTIASYIYKNYEQKLTLDDIAMAGNISKNKCCTLFKKYTKYSPIEFLNMYRLEVSTEMLRDTDETISAIAYDCGFGQHSYFNRLFLRKYDITPKEYRNQMQKKEIS